MVVFVTKNPYMVHQGTHGSPLWEPVECQLVQWQLIPWHGSVTVVVQSPALTGNTWTLKLMYQPAKLVYVYILCKIIWCMTPLYWNIITKLLHLLNKCIVYQNVCMWLFPVFCHSVLPFVVINRDYVWSVYNGLFFCSFELSGAVETHSIC